MVPLVFKTRERRAASLAGSIPVRLRQLCDRLGGGPVLLGFDVGAVLGDRRVRIPERLEVAGDPTSGQAVLVPDDASAPRIVFNKVPEPKTVKATSSTPSLGRPHGARTTRLRRPCRQGNETDRSRPARTWR